MFKKSFKFSRFVLPENSTVLLKKHLLGFYILNNVLFVPLSLCVSLVNNCLTMKIDKLNPAPIKRLQGTFLPILQQNFQSMKKDFHETLILKGVGFRANIENSKLHLHLGFSHVVSLEVPQNLLVLCPNKTTIFISGSCLETLKNFCFQIQSQKPIDVYKGKGIFYRTQTFKKKIFKK